MTEGLKLNLMKKFKKLNVAEYTTKYGDYYGLMFAGAEIATKELETQIDKMKCCENCKYNSYWGDELHCNYGLKEALQEDKLVECKNMDKWELKE